VPNITIDGPTIDSIEIKRVLIQEITDSIEKAHKIPRDHIVVMLHENFSSEKSAKFICINGKL